MTQQVDMANSLFTLLPGRWYAWEMIPGYGDDVNPYFSPILVERIEPLKQGTGDLRLAFINAFYAQGVQSFELDLRVLKRADRFMVVDLRYPDGEPQRAAVIGYVTMTWLNNFGQDLLRQRPVSEYGPVEDREVDGYLNWAFRVQPPFS